MKKVLSILLAIVLCASMSVVAFAAENTGSISVSAVEANAGDTVSVSVAIDANPGITSLQIKVNYDSTVLTLTEMTGMGMDGGVWTIEKWALWDNSANSTYVGQILTLKFTVDPEAAEAGKTYPISLEVAACNYDEEDVTFTVTNGSITVPCEHVWGEWVVTEEPTCTEEGVKTRTCAACGETETETVAATGHAWGEWTETKAPTCTEKGEETRECGNCGETETREVDMVAHTEEVIPGKAATCTEAGLTEGKKCSVCGEMLVAQEEIPALGHTEEVIPGKEATCTETGLTEGKKCSVCGEILVAQEEIPMTEHVWHWVVDKEATTEEPGVKHEECENCGAKRNEGTEIPKLDPGLDDEPGTGDITPMLTMGIVAVLSMAAAAAYVFKRKAVK